MRIEIIIKNIICDFLVAVGMFLILAAGSTVDVSCDYKKILISAIIGFVISIAAKKFKEW